MAQIASEDYANLLIYLHIDTVTNGFDPALMQKEHRTLRRLFAGGERKYDPMVSFVGNEDKGGGKKTPRSTRLRAGVRIVPYDTGAATQYSMDILNEILNVPDGLADQEVFDRSGVASNVDIDKGYDPVEVIEIISGSGVTEQDKDEIRDRILDADLRTHISPYSLSVTQHHLIYGRIVHIDVLSSNSGTAWPVGTDNFPVNNLADAKDIADAHGITEFHIYGTLVIGATDSINDLTLKGPHNIDALLILTAGCTTQNTRLKNLIVIGAFDGKANVELCTLLAITNFKGFILECVFADNIAIVDPATPTLIYNSGSGKVSPPITIDLNDSSLSAGGWKGNAKLINKTGSGTNYIELMSGTVEIDSSCVAGTIIIAGLGTVVDNSGAGCTVVTDNLENKTVFADAVWDKTLP
jgi:hypothetical protein